MLKKNTTQFSLLTFSLIIGYFLFWPVGFQPPRFTPPPAPALEGVLQPRSGFENLVATPTGLGPEDIAFDEKGFMYTGLEDGKIIRVNPLSGLTDDWVNTGGRPLGLAFSSQGNLIVADAKMGLLTIDKNRQIKT